jgi:hypothetical protein
MEATSRIGGFMASAFAALTAAFLQGLDGGRAWS